MAVLDPERADGPVAVEWDEHFTILTGEEND
jgi:hypothetical protein